MRKIICYLLIVLILPIPELLAQSEESTQTQETQTQETNKHATETANPNTVVPPGENPFDEFISPPYTCMFCRVYGGTLLQDAKHVVIFPTYFDSRKWLLFGGAVGSLFVISAFDDDIQDAIQRNRNKVTDKAASIINPFGFQAAYAVIAGIYLQGVFAHNAKSKVVALDAIAASVVSWGVGATLLKIITGRARPEKNEGQYHFDPFSTNGEDNSFPSGHATQAFALAAVLSSHYHSKWVWIPAYTFAGLVGLARMDKNRHWASDVVGGALLGTVVGKEFVVYNRRKRRELAQHEHKAQMTLVPMSDENGRSMNLFIRF